jgi:hypothetical protein
VKASEVLAFSQAQDQYTRCVDVQRVLEALNISFSRDVSAPYDGCCIFSVSDNGKELSEASIVVSGRTANVRERFTIAHEVGHILLHEPGRQYRDIAVFSSNVPVEVEANRFAAELLMPLDDMREMLSLQVQTGMTLGMLAGRVADVYQVSSQMAETRLACYLRGDW